MIEQGLDPLDLPSKTFEISFGFMGSAQANIYNGTLKGLSKVHRTGPFFVIANESGTHVHVDVEAVNTTVNYTLTISYSFMSRTVKVFGKIGALRVIVDISE